jgi:ATP-binding cassette, subfamily B, bacterial
VRGGMMGPLQTAGGVSRTYWLQDHFSKPELEGPSPTLSKTALKRISGYFKPYWKQWVVIFLCNGAMAGLNVMPPQCVRVILDQAIPAAHTGLLLLMAGAMVALAVVTGFIGVLEQSLTARVGQNIMFDLRNELFVHLQKMSLHFYTVNRSGEIVSRINNDVNAVQGVASRTLVAIVSNILNLAAASVALISMNWKLAILAVLVVPAFYMPSILVGRVRRKLSAQTQESQASLLAFMQERLHVGGALLTKIFGQSRPDADSFRNENDKVRELNVRQTIVGRWLFMVLSVFSVVGPALIYWYGGLQVIRDELTLGQLVAFAALLALLYRPLMQLSTVYVDIQASVAVFDRIFEYLDKKPGVMDGENPVSITKAEGRIVFDNVSFTYPTVFKAANGA